MPVRKGKRKGLRVSSFALFTVVFKRRHGNEGVNCSHTKQRRPLHGHHERTRLDRSAHHPTRTNRLKRAGYKYHGHCALAHLAGSVRRSAQARQGAELRLLNHVPEMERAVLYWQPCLRLPAGAYR